MFSRKAIVESIVAGSNFIFVPRNEPSQRRPGASTELETKYAITKTTDDKTDIVTAGSVLILREG